ncbi:MAG: hypothetical protein ACKV2T_42065 [Kofleriaceae bacterium]
MRVVAIAAAVCAPALAFGDELEPRPNIVVDAPVHTAPMSTELDREALRAGEEANLFHRDPERGRQGFFLHLGLGPSVTVGGGTGSGAGATLLLGTSLNETVVALVGLTVNAQRHQVKGTVYTNDYSSVTLGLQWWPRGGGVYWRTTFGVGGYRCTQCADPAEPTDPVRINYDRRGGAATSGVGIDLYRFSFGLVWGVEATAILMVHSAPGAVLSLGFHSFLSID